MALAQKQVRNCLQDYMFLDFSFSPRGACPSPLKVKNVRVRILSNRVRSGIKLRHLSTERGNQSCIPPFVNVCANCKHYSIPRGGDGNGKSTGSGKSRDFPLDSQKGMTFDSPVFLHMCAIKILCGARAILAS